MCRELGVDPQYLRVFVHRAKDKFKALYEKGRMETLRATGLETMKRFNAPRHYPSDGPYGP